jgi:hypothetical protein
MPLLGISGTAVCAPDGVWWGRAGARGAGGSQVWGDTTKQAAQRLRQQDCNTTGMLEVWYNLHACSASGQPHTHRHTQLPAHSSCHTPGDRHAPCPKHVNILASPTCHQCHQVTQVCSVLQQQQQQQQHRYGSGVVPQDEVVSKEAASAGRLHVCGILQVPACSHHTSHSVKRCSLTTYKPCMAARRYR